MYVTIVLLRPVIPLDDLNQESPKEFSAFHKMMIDDKALMNLGFIFMLIMLVKYL